MASPIQILLQNNQPVTQQLFNSFVAGEPLDFNGHKVQLIDGDTFKVDGQSHRLSGGDAYETDGHSRLLANGSTVKSTPEENALGNKARFQAAAQMLNNITKVTNTGSQSHGRDVSTAMIQDQNGIIKPKNIIDEMLSGGYATPVFSKNINSLDEMRRQNTLAGGTDTAPVVRKFMPNLASDQYRSQFANQVVSSVANRNPRIANISIGSTINQLFNDVSNKYNQSISVSGNINPMNNEHPELKISRDTLKLMTPEENDAANKKYEENTSLYNYLLGTQQTINKAVGKGVIGSLLRIGDEPTAASRLADRANEAYADNQKKLDELSNYYKSHGYKGHDTMLSASEIAPEIATELATAIPVAGQIGKIGTIANLAEKGLKGRMLAEGVKWGGAEIPASYLTGNQDHLGERVAFGAVGGAGVEGLLGVGGKLVTKGAKAYDDAKQAIKDAEQKTVNDIKTNPEPIEPIVSTEPREFKSNVEEEVFPNYHNFGKEGTSRNKFDTFNKMYDNGDFHKLQDSTIQKEMDRLAETGSDAVENNYSKKYINGLRNQYSKLKGILDERKVNAESAASEASTINEVPKVDTNTPEVPTNEIKSVSEQITHDAYKPDYNTSPIGRSDEVQFSYDRIPGFNSKTGKVINKDKFYDFVKDNGFASTDYLEHLDTLSNLSKHDAIKSFEEHYKPIIDEQTKYMKQDISIDGSKLKNIKLNSTTDKSSDLYKKIGSDSNSFNQHFNKFSSVDVLDSIIKSTNSSQFDKNVANRLFKILSEDNKYIKDDIFSSEHSIKIDKDISQRHGNGVGGDYNSSSNLTSIHPDYISNHVVLHELTHAAFAKRFRYIESIGSKSEHYSSYRAINNIFEKFKIDAPKANERFGLFGDTKYVFTNVHEFVSEAFSNPIIQDALKNMYMPSGKSYFNRIVDYVSKILGMKKNALDNILDLTNNISKHKYVQSDLFGGLKKHGSETIVQPMHNSNIDKLSIRDANKAIAHGIDQATNKVVDVAKTVSNVPAIKELSGKVSGVGKVIRDTLKEVSDTIPPVKQFTDALKAGDESLASAYKNLTSDISNDYLVKVYNKLSALTANMQKGSSEIAALTRGFTKQLMKDMSDGGKGLRESFTRHYLHTDYNAIKHLNIDSMEDVAKEIASREPVYLKASAEIEQGAKALKDRGEMNSNKYHNNAESIAKAKGITEPSEIRAIDELISLKALEPKDLEFIAKHKNDDWFRVMQAQAETLHNKSRELFESQNQEHNLVKGYYKEVYGKDNYIHEYDSSGRDVTKDMGTIKTVFGLDTKIPANLKLAQEAERVKGAVPLNAQKGTIGSKAIDAKDVTPEMDMSNYRAIRNKDGSIRQYNRVLDEERRATELNKNYDASDILADSFQSLYKKSGTDYISNWLKNDGKDIFHIGSKDKPIPDGFTKLSDKEISLLPKELRGEVVAVPADLKHVMMGNAAMGATEKASLQNVLHNVMREAGQHFKHNVVIANFNAYITNYVGGVASCLREGMTPMEIHRTFKEGNRLYTSMRSDINRMLYAETVGNKALSKKILTRLNDNPLWLMRNEGMAFTMIHDYLSHSGNRSMSHDMAETLLDKIQDGLGRRILDRKDAYNLEDGTKGGELASLGMSKIDVMSRYSIAMKHLEKNGKSITDKDALTEAVNYSNSIFGNSNKVVPRIVQYLDDMSIVPFGSWMFRVLAGNMKANKENMAQTLGIYVTMKTLGAGMGMHKISNGDPTTIPMNPAKAINRFGQTNLVTDVLNPFHPPQYQVQAYDAAKTLLK